MARNNPMSTIEIARARRALPPPAAGWARALGLSLTLGLVLQAGTAEAQRGKRGKAQREERTEERDEPAEPEAPKKAEAQALTQSGPTLKYEQFRRQVEFKVAEKREAQLEGLKKLLDSGPPEADVPDIKFRIAELYFEKARFYFFRQQEAEEKATAATDPGERDARKSEAKNHQKETATWDGRAIEVYKEIREKYPKYERMPEVLFALGQSYWTQARFDDAIAAYTDLIKSYKTSPLVPDAWLAFGEYYFNNAELNKALKAYELAASDKRARVYGFALYKQAWCYYNLGDWKKALEKFRATIFFSQMADTLSGENRISLAREAQKDFVKTYAFIGDETRAKFVLGDITADEDCKTPECRKLVEQLAGLWYDTGKFEQSAALYRELIRMEPGSTRAPYYQGRVVDLVSRSTDKRATINEVRKLVDIYKAVEQRAQTDKSEKTQTDLRDAEALAEATVRRLAQLWNSEAKKLRSKPVYEFAKPLYVDYLSLFANSKYAYEMRFQLADLYYKLEAFDDAAKAYEATVLADAKGKYVSDAANDNVLALEEHLKDLNLPKPKVTKGQAAEIHPERRRLIDACDRYAKFVPPEKAEKNTAVRFKAAKIFYDHNQFEEAIKRFEDLVETRPEADESETSANLVVDTYNYREDWKGLYEASSRYLRNEALLKNRPKLKQQLVSYGEYAKFKLVQILEEERKTQGATLEPVAKAYEDFQAEFPRSENADKALYNASVTWDLVGNRERADQLRKRLLEEYRDSPLRADVQFYVAKSFEQRAEYGKAAELFEQFSDAYPADGRARDALYNAGVFYAGIGQVKAANALRTKYLQKYGKTKEGEAEAAAISFAMARDLDRAKRWSEAAAAYMDFTKKFPGDERVYEALYREGRIRKKRLKQDGPADKAFQTLVLTYGDRQKSGAKLPATAADFASRAAFQLLDKTNLKYQAMKIERPNLKNPANFKRTLDAKVRGREEVVRAYTNVVTGYQQARSTIGSLYRIAKSWDNFVATLLAVPCPIGLNEGQCEAFKQELETQVSPARDSALNAYKACVDKSNELKVFTGFSRLCVRNLERLMPDAYPPLAERKAALDKGGDKGRGAPKRVDVRANGLILRTDVPGAIYVGPTASEAPAARAPAPAAKRSPNEEPDDDTL